MKSASIVEGEATPTRSVPLPEEEKEEESEEVRDGGIVVVAISERGSDKRNEERVAN